MFPCLAVAELHSKGRDVRGQGDRGRLRQQLRLTWRCECALWQTRAEVPNGNLSRIGGVPGHQNHGPDKEHGIVWGPRDRPGRCGTGQAFPTLSSFLPFSQHFLLPTSGFQPRVNFVFSHPDSLNCCPHPEAIPPVCKAVLVNIQQSRFWSAKLPVKHAVPGQTYTFAVKGEFRIVGPVLIEDCQKSCDVPCRFHYQHFDRRTNK